MMRAGCTPSKAAAIVNWLEILIHQFQFPPLHFSRWE
jgi:hypothetical protein